MKTLLAVLVLLTSLPLLAQTPGAPPPAEPAPAGPPPADKTQAAPPLSSSADLPPKIPGDDHLVAGGATRGNNLRRGDLNHDWPRDGALTVSAGAFWAFTEINKEKIAPLKCRWCAADSSGNDRLNGVDAGVTRALGWGDIKTAARIGDVFGFGVVPVAMFGSLGLASYRSDRFGEMPVNALVMLETLMLYGATNQIVKFAAGRERPFVRELPPDQKGNTAAPADNNVSFFSAHSGVSFCLVVSAGTIAHLRGYDMEPVIWGVGLPLAAFTAYSRIAAKKHYFTDVVTGTAIGSAFGFAIPFFFHQPQAPLPFTIAPTSDGAAISGTF